MAWTTPSGTGTSTTSPFWRTRTSRQTPLKRYRHPGTLIPVVRGAPEPPLDHAQVPSASPHLSRERRACRRLEGFEMRRFFRSAAFPILIVIVLAFFAQRLISSPSSEQTPTYDQFISQVKNNPSSIESVTFDQKASSITVDEPDGKSYSTGYPTAGNAQSQVLNRLQSKDIETTIEGTGGSSFLSILTYILPFVLFFGFWLFLMNQMQGGGSRVMSFGKSRAKRMSVDAPKITFRDVAGADEAVQELHEIKEFLENPKKFQSLGARIPKGVLLYGPPGTGKTLLARAVAGEAGVPFFSISGSDFVEMFVGVGASRVRDLFEQAKQNSPCIIFMDEIDAVGRHRGA